MASESSIADGSRIPNFFKLDLRERVRALQDRGLLNEHDARALESGSHTLRNHVADRMIENVVGVFGLPLGLGLNFLINGKDYVVPLAVEEPSIVAGLSGAARTARLSGGFKANATDPILIGQVQVAHLDDAVTAQQKLLEAKQAILDLANSLHPKMVARGGGAQDVEVYIRNLPDRSTSMLVLHLLVDTRDAMGANVVNSMCEGVASLVESISSGRVFLRILSNLTDRALVQATVRIPVENLNVKNYSGAEVCDGIVLASGLAQVDPYRAATHNKGIMNGVDAVALATGNDFRAIEAAAHAYAARDGSYRGLAQWRLEERNTLVGTIEMPMKVGTVGGSLQTNPSVRIAHRLLGSPSAQELAQVMGAVGLGQNYAALRALVSSGIQQNHMTLHARSVATTANVPDELFDAVVDALIEDGEIKVWKARDIVQSMRSSSTSQVVTGLRSSASGKVILIGEHAVVYGYPALAVPIPLAVEAKVVDAETSTLVIPRWGLEQRIPDRAENSPGVAGVLAMLLDRLNLDRRGMTIEVFPNFPRAVGLGGSSAMSVAVIRALSDHYQLNLAPEEINQFAYECETSVHGTPSGVDNTVATYGVPMLYSTDGPDGKPHYETLQPVRPVPLVIGISGKESLTAGMVAKVAAMRARRKSSFDRIFSEIGSLALAAVDAFRDGELDELGELMNLCHGLLNAMQLSTPQLEELVHIARESGAVGAKLTGAGGGGSVVALCPHGTEPTEKAISAAGYQAIAFEVE